MQTSELENTRSEFAAWVQNALRPRVLARQVQADVFDSAMDRARFLPDVIARQQNQKEVLLPIWEYLEIAASDERTRKGRKVMRENRTLLNAIESAYGVEPEVVCAVWGLETGYGVVRGDFPVLSALATLAFRGRRARFFEDELVAGLRLIQGEFCTPPELVGSWAGAIGHGQFMPSSVLDFGVDFDGDGRTNLCADEPTDALASIANYLKKHGWRTGQPWGCEVILPDGFDYMQTGLDQSLPSTTWAAMGVCRTDGSRVPDYGLGSIHLPAGSAGVAVLVLRNFFTIMSYNASDSYALGIGLLSDRIAGGKDFEGRWPLGEAVLSQAEVLEVQTALSEAGFGTQGIDGFRGPNTTRAARAYQAAQGLRPDGHLNGALLARLRGAG